MTSYWRDLDRTVDPQPPDRGTAPDLGDEPVDVVVVGAGITGMTTALLLARSGKRVVVVEARDLGAGTTGHTTGKVSLLQGTKLSRLLRVQSERVVGAYLEANREGQAWLLRFCDGAGIDAERRTAMTFAATAEQRAAAEEEHRAATRLGLPTRWTEHVDAPVRTFGAVALEEQAQLDPMPVLHELARELAEHGGILVEHARVTWVSKVGRPTVGTDTGLRLECDDVVLATGTPVLDRGLYFAKLTAHRSYVLLYADATPLDPMLLSAGGPTRSLREVVDPQGGSRLMVGGEGHVVGRAGSEAEHLDRLREWTAEHYPQARETHAWSAQDYESHDGIPYVGPMPRGRGHVWVATGFDKWGLTNGVAAALRIAGEVLGHTPSWAVPMSRRVTRPRGAARLAAANAGVGAALVGGLVAAEATPADPDPAEGAGVVGRRGVNPVPVATSTVDGARCSLVALCTHLGGVLHWNDAERTWDCPLHGSRFAADGDVLEGRPPGRCARHRPTDLLAGGVAAGARCGRSGGCHWTEHPTSTPTPWTATGASSSRSCGWPRPGCRS